MQAAVKKKQDKKEFTGFSVNCCGVAVVQNQNRRVFVFGAERTVTSEMLQTHFTVPQV